MSEPVGAAAAPADATTPPFDPDPELIDHLEGNARVRRAYRQAAERLRATTDARESRDEASGHRH